MELEDQLVLQSVILLVLVVIVINMLSWLQGEPGRDGRDGDPGTPGQAVRGVIAESHDLSYYRVMLVREVEMVKLVDRV